MNYALEESVVDAFVAYLGGKVGGGAKVYAAPATENIQYPAVCVRVAQMGPMNESLSWSDYLAMVVEIAIINETAAEIDEHAVVISKVRMSHALVRQSVISALTVKDSADTPEGLADLCDAQDLPHGLAAQLTAMRIPGVWVSSAQPASPLAVMEVDEEHHALVTKITVNVIAQAIEL